MSAESSGLYHPYFTEEEIRDLEAVPCDDLTGEIYLQRHLLCLVMSESPPDLDFDLLLEKNRACNTAIRSLISLIYAELQIRRNRTPEWELFYNAAHLLSAEQLGIVDDVFPADVAAAIRAENPYYRRQMETACPAGMEATFDTAKDPTLLPDTCHSERAAGRVAPRSSGHIACPDPRRDRKTRRPKNLTTDEPPLLDQYTE